MRVCLVLEGSYPYVYGGVSTWMHGCIRGMPVHFTPEECAALQELVRQRPPPPRPAHGTRHLRP